MGMCLSSGAKPEMLFQFCPSDHFLLLSKDESVKCTAILHYTGEQFATAFECPSLNSVCTHMQHTCPLQTSSFDQVLQLSERHETVNINELDAKGF